MCDHSENPVTFCLAGVGHSFEQERSGRILPMERIRKMKLIIGGAFQGKKKFAETLTGIPAGQFADGLVCEKEAVFEQPVICHFHECVRRMLEKNQDTTTLVHEILKKNPDLVIISNELGYGVVPTGQFDRHYRETTGRICTQAAAAAEEVYRVVCGIPTRIK